MLGCVGIGHILAVAIGQLTACQGTAVTVVDHGVVVLGILDPLGIEDFLAAFHEVDVVAGIVNHFAVSFGGPADEGVVVANEGVGVHTDVVLGCVGAENILGICLGLTSAKVGIVDHAVVILFILDPLGVQDLGVVVAGKGNDLVCCVSFAGAVTLGVPADEGVVLTNEGVGIDGDVQSSCVGAGDILRVFLGFIVAEVGIIDQAVGILGVLDPLGIQDLGVVAGSQSDGIACGVRLAGAVTLGIPASEGIVLTNEGVGVHADIVGGCVDTGNILGICLGLIVAKVGIVSQAVVVLCILTPGADDHNISSGHYEIRLIPAGEGVVRQSGSSGDLYGSAGLVGLICGNFGSACGHFAYIVIADSEGADAADIGLVEVGVDGGCLLAICKREESYVNQNKEIYKR